MRYAGVGVASSRGAVCSGRIHKVAIHCLDTTIRLHRNTYQPCRERQYKNFPPSPRCIESSMSNSPANGVHSPAPSSSMAPAYDHDIRWANRHSEHIHEELLAASWVAHERVREQAELTLSNVAALEEAERLMKLRKQEEERIRIATIQAQEQIRIRELENAARQIPKPPPRLPTPPPPAPAPIQQPSPTPTPIPQPTPKQDFAQSRTATPQTLVSAAPPQQQAQPNHANPFAQRAPLQPVQPPQQVAHVPKPATKPSNPLEHLSPRYVEIHKSCKELRKFVLNYHPELKKQAGNMRRVIQRSVGQLTDVKGANAPIASASRHSY